MNRITNEHLRKSAVLYVRQSTVSQIQDHAESRKLQYGLAERAREIGFSSVEVIDDDLGLSGSGHVNRPGFERLVSLVCSGEVGGVVCMEASRLARNGRDWHHLVDLCAVVGSVLIDHDGVYDPRLLNDRLLLGLKGTMSEYELSLLRQRALGARESKAKRGELRFGLPPGFCWDEFGRIEKDPNRRVVEAINLVFRKFVELGSARQVFFWLQEAELELPVVRQSSRNRIHWQSPRYHGVLAILKHPIYAGAYSFGRTETRVRVIDGRAIKTEGHHRPREQWTVLLKDHHPAFISWEEYERNQAILEENAYMRKRSASKSGRGGQALLAGIMRCGRCGRMLGVAYGSRPTSAHRYVCRGDEEKSRSPCLRVGGVRVDRAVSQEIVRAVSPIAVEAAKEAAAMAMRASSDVQEAVRKELQQAQDEARLAERRYEAVDPEKRLVAAELEARWDAALQKVTDIQRRLTELDAMAEQERSADDVVLNSLARDLIGTWNDPSASMRAKQRIVRILVQEVVIDIDHDASENVLFVHWTGGRHTEIRVARRSGAFTKNQHVNAIDAIRKMAPRWSDKQIARTLNRIRCSFEYSSAWTQLRVRQIRDRLGLPNCVPEDLEPTVTREQAAAILDIGITSVKKLIDDGILPASQIIPGAPWEIPSQALDSEAVRQGAELFRSRRPANIMKTQYNMILPLPEFHQEDA